MCIFIGQVLAGCAQRVPLEWSSLSLPVVLGVCVCGGMFECVGVWMLECIGVWGRVCVCLVIWKKWVVL